MNLTESRVMVTGGAGFLGRRVVAEFRRHGITDIIVPRRKDVDLTRQDSVEQLIAEVQPEIVVHLAAEVGGIGANRENPGRYFYANITMGLNLIEASRVEGVSKVVQVGTVCSYPRLTPVPFVEGDLWNGYPEETNAPYGIAKKSLLTMLQAYRDQYGFNGIYLIPVNLYGPDDNFDPASSHVIPALIRRFVSARDAGDTSVTVWGTGAASREFLYVDDAASAIVKATFDYDDPEPVNVGSGDEIRVKVLVAIVAKLTGFDGQIEWDTSKPDGQPRRRLNTERAERLFGFKAETDLDNGLKRTIKWWEQTREFRTE